MISSNNKNITLSILLIIASVIALIIALSAKPLILNRSGYSTSKCNSQLSHYKNSETYLSEKKDFTSNARAFEVISSNDKKFRVISDYSIISNNVDEIELIIAIISDDKFIIDNPKISLENNGVSFFNFDIKNDEVFLVNNKSPRVLALNLKKELLDKDLSLKMLDGNGCLVQIDQIFNAINSSTKIDQKKSSAIIAPSIANSTISPGASIVGFTDWIPSSTFEQLGLTVSEFNDGKFFRIKNKILEPGKGYLIYNPNNEIAIQAFKPFYVPESITRRGLKKGWNLIYNDDKDLSIDKYYFKYAGTGEEQRSFNSEIVSLKTLIGKQKASDSIFKIKKDSDKFVIEKKDLSESQVINEKSAFWFYLYDQPEINNLELPNLSMKINAPVSVSASEEISFKIEVTNSSPSNYKLIGGSQNDRCTFGIVIRDDDLKEIYSDLNKRTCPLWPKLTELKSNEKIEYNYSWKPPKSLKGTYKVEVYYDYSRLNSTDMLYNETRVNFL